MAKKTTTRRVSRERASQDPPIEAIAPPAAEAQKTDESSDVDVGVDVDVDAKGEPATASPDSRQARREEQPHWVELLEGTSYGPLRGKTFYRNRPQLVTDPRILEAVLHNGRFHCKPVARRTT